MVKKMFQHYDYSLIIAILLLSGFGLLMVYSSSIVWSVIELKQSSNFFFVKQLKWLVIALIMFFLTMLFPYKAYKRFMKLVVIVSIMALFAVKIFGSVANNAQSWISFGGINIQPAEFVKLGMIIYLAAIFSKKQTYISDFTRAVLPPLIMIVFVFLLVASQPDLGTALIIASISGVMIICSGMKIKHLLSLIGLAALAIRIAAYFLLSDEQSSRFDAAYDPFSDPNGDGYQLVNSYIAIASGGVSGRGLGQSIQKFGFLPEPQTDFIMAIISEELGIFGVTFVLGLLGFIVFKGFLIGMRCKDTFGSLLAIGISAMLAIQSIVNLGAVTGLLPITGVPLPFISYGGSFLVLSMIAMGILVNISSFVNMKQSHSRADNVKEGITVS